MAWLSNFFDKLFRLKASPAPQDSAPKQNIRPKAKQKIKQNLTSQHGKYRQNTLGCLLQNTPSPSPDDHAYNLQEPPAIARDVLERLRKNIKQIPPMPEIWHQVQTILQQPDASASDLGRCVAQDPVLTAQLLKACNSSRYAVSGSAEVSHIPLAIARLGLDEASSIIFRCLAPDLGKSEQSKMEIRQIWFHSRAIAALARMLAEAGGELTRHEASLLGMLHDIGKLVILHLESAPQLECLQAHIEQGTRALTAEHGVLGYTHVDAGVLLALHWQLPKHVQRLISFHHHPTLLQADALPEDMRHAMMTLHVAHLILQHNMLQYQMPKQSVDTVSQLEFQAGAQAEGQARAGQQSIWQQHRRPCLRDTLRFVQNEMHIPLDSEAWHIRLQTEVERLKLSFSDLF